MSRGPGWVQHAVLGRLSSHSGSTTFETLRWQLWELSAEGPVIPGRNLPNAWNTSVMRAVKSLDKDRHIEVKRRRLASFEECVDHFPNKTLLGSVRHLRLQLLPALQRGIQEGEFLPRYGPAANEKFHLESLTPHVRKTLRASWLRLEPRLIDLLPQSGLAGRNALFQLVAKGKSIFETPDLQCQKGFAEHVRYCNELHLLPELLAAEAKTLSESILAPTDAGHLQLKDYIHTFAHVPRHRGCSLKKATVEYLDRECREVVRNLPDYVAPQEPLGSRYSLLGEREPKHSPQLYGLFDQTVFQSFHFLRIA